MPERRIELAIPGQRPYEILIGPHLLDELDRPLSTLGIRPSHLILITDETVGARYLASARAALERLGLPVSDIVVPAGEEAKSVACAEEIWRAMADLGVGRDCCVLALGGGVVGDLAGFVAATYMRGVRYLQVPTTLLAMVDSSVGGKTAVNIPEGKNLVGVFKQPSQVIASLDCLSSLPEREWACGLAEVAKSALIDSDEFFFWLGDHAAALAHREPEAVAEAVERCVRFKAAVVAADEQELSGVRECLNYGHTFGHAIEQCAGFGVYSHGAAVAEGMRFAIRLGAAVAGTPLDLVKAQDELLDELGLPQLSFDAPADRLLAAMHRDKKARQGRIAFIVPTDVGRWERIEPDDDLILEHIAARSASLEARS